MARMTWSDHYDWSRASLNKQHSELYSGGHLLRHSLGKGRMKNGERRFVSLPFLTPAMMKFPLTLLMLLFSCLFCVLFSIFPLSPLYILLSSPHLGSISGAAERHNSDRQSAALRCAKFANGKFYSQL